MNFEGAFLAWTALAIFIPLALSVAVPGVYRTWVEYRSRSKALDVLRVSSLVSRSMNMVAGGPPAVLSMRT